MDLPGNTSEPAKKSKRGSKTTDIFFENEKTLMGTAKHAVLYSYLGFWMGILCNNFRKKITKGEVPDYSRIVYIDGFAGPGHYGKEKLFGSPTQALERALTHVFVKKDGPDVVLIFIENEEKYCETLMENLKLTKDTNAATEAASKVSYMVINGKFATAMNWILDENFKMPENSMEKIFSPPTKSVLETSKCKTTNKFITSTTPLHVFADPFSPNGADMPMSITRSILACSKYAEILINIITWWIMEHMEKESATNPLSLLVGEDKGNIKWKECVFVGQSPEARTNLFLDYYIDALCKEQGDVKDLRYEVRAEKDQLKYHLCFVCHHPNNFVQMKRHMSMFSHEDGELKFSAKEELQGGERSVEDAALKLRDKIIEEFKGKNRVSALDINDFILHKTGYFQRYRDHLKELLKDYRLDNTDTRAFDEMIFNFSQGDTSIEQLNQDKMKGQPSTSEPDQTQDRKNGTDRISNKVLDKYPSTKLRLKK